MATFTGTDGTNIMLGGPEDDTMFGFGGNDTLSGGGGNDTLDGGSGNDVLTGGPGTDLMTGGTGVDIFRDSAAGFNTDRITDFLPGDRIQFTDLTKGTANLVINGTTLSYNGGSLTIDTLGPGRFVQRDITGGGFEVRLQQDAHNDFNGDGFSDVLWRSDTGQLTRWQGTKDGAFVASSVSANVPTDWKVAGTGDFNGDGREDILWRHDSGVLTDWLANASGGFDANSNNLFTSVPTDWHVVGTGDFNGDGRSDVLWRHDSGAITDWLATPSGGFVANDATVLGQVPLEWKVAGTGDFNGDGLVDILWRHDSGAVTNWLGTAEGGFVANDANVLASVPNEWHIVGTGDFNGDGIEDILWRHDSGFVTDWLGNENGGFSANDANGFAGVPLDWAVVGTGDYNADGIDDILWRQTGGEVTNWLGTPSGGFTDNWSHAAAFMAPTWHEADPFH
jgi:hypothetical protein